MISVDDDQQMKGNKIYDENGLTETVSDGSVFATPIMTIFVLTSVRVSSETEANCATYCWLRDQFTEINRLLGAKLAEEMAFEEEETMLK